MDSAGVLSLLEQLGDEIDDLKGSLVPVLSNEISSTTSKLPLLDKAKLYILMTYAIESIIFSYIRLNGINARNHPVFKELSRVKQYFDKIKNAEALISKRGNMSLDKQAAARFIRASLAGNEKHDLEQAERQAKEKARLHIRQEKFTPETKDQREGKPETIPFDVRQSLGRSGSYSGDFSPQSITDGGSLSKKRKASALKSSEAEASNLGRVEQRKVGDLEIKDKKAKR